MMTYRSPIETILAYLKGNVKRYQIKIAKIALFHMGFMEIVI